MAAAAAVAARGLVEVGKYHRATITTTSAAAAAATTTAMATTVTTTMPIASAVAIVVAAAAVSAVALLLLEILELLLALLSLVQVFCLDAFVLLRKICLFYISQHSGRYEVSKGSPALAWLPGQHQRQSKMQCLITL